MPNDRFENSPIVEGSRKFSDSVTMNSLNKGGIMRFIRTSCAALMLAASMPAPAFSASPDRKSVVHLAADPQKEFALSDPMSMLDSIPTIKHKPWAKEFLVAAYKKNPHALLAKASKFEDQPYYQDVIIGAFQWASQNDPAVVFMYSYLLEAMDPERPQLVERILETSLRRLSRVDPYWLIVHCKDFNRVSGAEGALMAAAAQMPWAMFEYKDEEVMRRCAHASSLFLGAVRKDPDLALKDPQSILEYGWAKGELFRAMRKNPEIALKNLSQLKGWESYREYFRELSKKDPTLALRAPDLIIEFGWAREELFRAMRKNPEVALEGLSKLKHWHGYWEYFGELSNLFLSKNPRYLLDHADQIPEGFKKTMIVDSLRARLGE